MTYELLHYKGDVRKAAQVGDLLGWDEIGHPWEIIDTEYDEESDRTTVHLQPASVEAMRR